MGSRGGGGGGDFMRGGLTEESEHTAGENGMRRCCFRCVLTSLPVSLLLFLPFLSHAWRCDPVPLPCLSVADLLSGASSRSVLRFALLCCRSYLICLSARRISPGEERPMLDVVKSLGVACLNGFFS
ncbi:unnamed protein product [Musa banksii]